MIRYFEGSIFNVNTDAVVNAVNTKGFMGRGLALEFKLRYNAMFLDYKEKCENGLIRVGKVDYYKDREVIIVNFPTKKDYKRPSNLCWIEQGLKDFIRTYKHLDIKSVAFPKLGTGYGGLNWIDVHNLMIQYLGDLDIDVYICLDELKLAAGDEALMLEQFNNVSLEQLKKLFKLNYKQILSIDNNRPYKRFWHIYDTESIGETTYTKIFRYYFNNHNKSKNILTQTTLF